MNLSDFIEFPFLQLALVAIILLSLISGLVSPIIVSKRYAFMGASISHAALFGVAVGLAIFGQDATLGVFITSLFITAGLSLLLGNATFRSLLPGDSSIGVFLSATMGAGMVIHQVLAKGQGSLLNYLFGNILLLNKYDLLLLALILFLVLIIIIGQFSKWKLYLIDEEMAEVQGLKVKYFHYGLILLLTLIIISAVKVAGTVLINSFLLVPGLYAIRTSKSVRETFIRASLFALVTGLVGLVIGNWLEYPIGSTLAVFQFISLIIAIKLYKYTYKS